MKPELLSNSSFTTDRYRVQFAWDSVSRDYILTCPRKYQLAIRQGWQPKHTALPLQFGLAFHELMEHFHKRRATGYSKLNALRQGVREALHLGNELGPDPKGYRTRESLLRAFIWYHLNYWNDPTQTVILANGKAAVELSFRYEAPGITAPDGTPYLFTGHLDRLATFGGKVYAPDYKTTQQTISADWFSKYRMDDQMSGYDFGVRVTYGPETAGVLVDGIQLAVTFTRFQRGFALRTEAQRDEWMWDTIRWIKLAEEFAVAEVDLGHTQWPMNRKACHHYGGCMFLEVCEKHPSVRQQWLEREFEQRPWDPLKVR